MNINEILYPSDIYKQNYDNAINYGKKHLSEKKIIIVGLARNIENKIKNNISKLIKLGESSKKYKILIFENDSSDNTKNILLDISSKNDNIITLSETLNHPIFGQTRERERTDALAEYRNKLLKLVKEKYNHYDYTIVVDLDFLDFSVDGCYNSFGWLALHNDIDAVAGNAFEIKNMLQNVKEPSLWNYDCWAYRPTWWSYTNNNKYINYDPMLWFGLFIPPVGSSIFSVNSAFGGMAIYKTNKYINGIYDGRDCEHVTFHKSLTERNNTFSLYLNPSQVMLV